MPGIQTTTRTAADERKTMMAVAVAVMTMTMTMMKMRVMDKKTPQPGAYVCRAPVFAASAGS